MEKPKMIMFDYGHTLLWEPNWNSARGNAELMKYAVKNPHSCTVEDVINGAKLIYGDHLESIRRLGYDISGQVGNRALYDYLGIEFSLTPLEMETVFWDAASIGAVMPGAEKMLDYLNENGIRSAVISNLLWSGDALKNRLDRLLPNNRFEFVITSSDYVFRKPQRILFEIALNKAKLEASDVWYCGDNPRADIEGAYSVGITPVWYDNETGKAESGLEGVVPPNCEHIYIQQWDELISVLEAR